MKKEQLEQYRSLKREIEELDIKILAYKTHDVVKSSVQFPYSPHCVTVRGYPSKKSLDKLKAQRLNCKTQCKAIESFINGIDDSLTRRIFRLRYLDGRRKLSFRQLSNRIEGYEESTLRKKHDRYLKKKKVS